MTSASDSAQIRPWWERRPVIALLILLTAVPLLYPPVPPLVDLFGHMGRFRVQLDLDTSPWLGRYYGFAWQPIGNLGVDLLIEPLSRLFGLELSVKLIVLAMPPTMAAGFLWVAREVHHRLPPYRLPPTAMFALPFVYSHPFMFGFANYSLSIALAFVAFGLWLNLAGRGLLLLRALLFVPISFVVFFAHTFGWGMLGLLAFSAEAVRQHDNGRFWLHSGVRAAAHASVMALPAAVILLWRSNVETEFGRLWFEPLLKLEGLISVLRDRWQAWDLLSLAAVVAVLLFACVSRRMTFSRHLGFSALVLALVYAVLPWMIFESAYADMRLAPFVFAVALLAIRFRDETHWPTAHVLAVLGLLFFLLRIAGNTWSLAIAADDQAAKLEALDRVPQGARVASLVGRGCGLQWALGRNSHLGAMAIVRRHGFSNDQWVIEGMNLLSLRYDAGLFSADASEIVRPNGCPTGPWWINRALTALPRGRFDYVWMIDPHPFDPALTWGMEPVWSGANSILFRIDPDAAARPGARPRTAAEPERQVRSQRRKRRATRR
jgi:hypothetical protein